MKIQLAEKLMQYFMNFEKIGKRKLTQNIFGDGDVHDNIGASDFLKVQTVLKICFTANLESAKELQTPEVVQRQLQLHSVNV